MLYLFVLDHVTLFNVSIFFFFYNLKKKKKHLLFCPKVKSLAMLNYMPPIRSQEQLNLSFRLWRKTYSAMWLFYYNFSFCLSYLLEENSARDSRSLLCPPVCLMISVWAGF